jgi:hypothetical protein
MEAKTADMQLLPEHDIVQRLQRENAALRAELQALRSNTQLQSSHQSTVCASHEQTFDFVKLPRELRNLVEELCVVVGNIYIALPAKFYREDMRCQRPRDAAATTSLFAVNKQIRHEALELYLSKNHFILTAFSYPALPIHLADRPLSQIPGCIEPRVLVHLRSVSISLDTQSMRIARYSGDNPTDFILGPDSRAEIRSIMIHYNAVLIELLHDFCNALEGLITSCAESCGNLRRIQFNVQNTVCDIDYHRFVIAIFRNGRVKEVLRHFADKARKVESLDFLGTINDKERRVIRLAFPESIRKKITFHGQLDINEWKWDPTVEILDEKPSKHDALDSSSEDFSSEDLSSE